MEEPLQPLDLRRLGQLGRRGRAGDVALRRDCPGPARPRRGDRSRRRSRRGGSRRRGLVRILSANGAFYKVVDPTTIVVVPDTPQKRADYAEQVNVTPVSSTEYDASSNSSS